MPPTRREFLKSTGAAGLATALAGAANRARAQSATEAQPRTVQTDVLDIGYEEHGNPNGTAIVLLHGFPFDVRSFDGVVAPLVAGLGFVPMAISTGLMYRSNSFAARGASSASDGTSLVSTVGCD